MSAHYIAAVDQGTTSTRCMIFDRQGRMVALAQREHRQYYPHSGWVEHDAAEIWSVVQRLLPQALHDAGVGPEQIAGLGITNQRETSVLWNRRTGKPVSRAIVWQDTRTAGLLPRIAEDLDPAVIHDLSGLPLVNYFSGPKIRWLLDEHGLREQAEEGDLLFGTIDSWLVWNLTGGVEGGLNPQRAEARLSLRSPRQHPPDAQGGLPRAEPTKHRLVCSHCSSVTRSLVAAGLRRLDEQRQSTGLHLHDGRRRRASTAASSPARQGLRIELPGHVRAEGLVRLRQAVQDAGGDATVTYTKTGSSDGKKGLADKTVDFAGSDSPIKPEERRRSASRKILYFPIVGGPIAVAYNLRASTSST